MTLMRLQFAGKIMKVEAKQAGTKPLYEISLCKKHKGKNGADDSYTWIRVTLWEPADFQKPLLIKGAFVSGCGDIQLRSYDAKDGTKKTSLECRSNSFEIEIADNAQSAPLTSSNTRKDNLHVEDNNADSPPF
jgi:single-stranded DNA-binding protein